MTDAELDEARRLLAQTPIFDGHNDLPWVIRIDPTAKGDVRAYGLDRLGQRGDTDIPRLKAGCVGAQFWAAFQPTHAPHPARTALEQIDIIRQIEEAHPDAFYPARKASDFARAQSQGKIASYITVEGGVGLENSLAPLRIWHAAGMRLMTLCHNETLDWVDSATDRPRNGGLNAFGRTVVHELNRLGVIVDCSHVSAEGARAAIAASRAPIALTHSNSFSLCDHPRNAPDDVVRSLGEAGGLVLATFVPAFLSQARRNWQARARGGHDGAPAVTDPKEQFEHQQAQTGMAPRTTLAMVVDHIERLIDLAGAEHVGIGSDFFGGPQPDGLEDVSRFPNLISECLRRKFSKKTIAGLASANMLAFMRRVERVGTKLRKTEKPKVGRLEDYPGA
jgi:membrane dipeptidase